jgi:hypothetical protein
MAKTDRPDDVNREPLPDASQLEAEMVAALRAIARDKNAQTAARATAAKAVLEWSRNAPGAVPGTTGTDPGALTLEEIEAALRRLGNQ